MRMQGGACRWGVLTCCSGGLGDAMAIGVLFSCFGRTIDGPGLPGGLIIHQGHLFPLKGHLWQWSFADLLCSLLFTQLASTFWVR